MTVARLLGVVPVKMFDSGQVFDFSTFGANYSSWNFEGQSTAPMLYNGVSNSADGAVEHFSAEIMGVFGLSRMEYNQAAQPLGGQAQVYIDDTVYFTGLGKVNPALYSKRMPRPTGNWTFKQFSYFDIPTAAPPTAFLRFGSGSGVIPLMLAGQPAIGALSNSSSDPAGLIKLLQLLPNGDNVFASTLNGTPLVTLAAAASNLAVRNPRPGAQYDNYWFVSGTGLTPGCKAVSFKSTDFDATLNIQSLSMDNPTLDAVFQNIGIPNCKAYYNGFIFPLVVNGAGITKQYCEVCVFTYDMTGYYILALEAMDTISGVQLSRGTSIPQVKIDTDGIIWFNSGNALDIQHVLYSFSSGYNFPVYYLGSLQPIVIPCLIDSLPGVQYTP